MNEKIIDKLLFDFSNDNSKFKYHIIDPIIVQVRRVLIPYIICLVIVIIILILLTTTMLYVTCLKNNKIFNNA